MKRQLRIAALLGFFLLSFLTMLHSARAQSTSPKQPSVQPVMDQMTDIPYFTLRDGMNSTLTLNNVGPTSTPVTVTIYNLEGKAQVLDAITLAPHSFKQIELRDVIVGDDFDSGNLRVAYTGISMGVTCQVSVSNPDKRVSFESRDVWGQQDMKDMMPSMSKKLSGILWLPQETAEGFLAVTNIGKTKVTVQVSTGSKPRTVALYSRETRLVKLSEESGEHRRGASLVQLQHDGMPGDVVTTGFVLDLKRGYSSAFTLFDPGLMRSSHLAGAHLRIGAPDPSEGFPEGTLFRSPLLLANIGPNPVQAHVSLDYTVRKKLEMSRWDDQESSDSEGVTEEKFSTVKVVDVSIRSGAVARVELSEALEKLGIDRITEAGVDIDYDAPPGTLIGHLVSADQTGDYAFEVPIKDPAAMMEMMEGIYPWTLEDGNNTVLHLKNTTDNPVNGLLLFDYYDNGTIKTYNYPLISLEPYQTVAIDIQKLKDSNKPDVRGQLFPADVTHGQAQWRQEIPYSMIGRAEQTNMKEGIARSFSCGYECCLNYLEDDTLDPNPIDVNSGINRTLIAHKNGTSCNGFAFGPTVITASTWTSGLSSIVTVSSGLVSYVGNGSTDVSANVNQNYYDDGGTCSCHHHTQVVPVSAQVRAGPYPVGFHLTNFTTSSGVLHFTYVWGSSTGRLSDLAGICLVGEIVTYPGAPAPFYWPSPPFPNNPPINPNPAVLNVAGSQGFLTDDHIWDQGHGGFVKPYKGSFFDATQVYQYKCGNQATYTPLTGPLTIDRTVSPSTGSTWKYVITKTGGYTTSIDPLP